MDDSLDSRLVLALAREGGVSLFGTHHLLSVQIFTKAALPHAAQVSGQRGRPSISHRVALLGSGGLCPS